MLRARPLAIQLLTNATYYCEDQRVTTRESPGQFSGCSVYVSLWTTFEEPWFDFWQIHGAFPSPKPSHGLFGPPSLVITWQQGLLPLKYSGRSIKQNIIAAYMYFNSITFFHILQVLFFINVYILFLFNIVIYVILFLCLSSFIV